MKLYITIVIILLTSFHLIAQQSTLWNEYKKASTSKATAKLPNFSFAGYQYGEKAIPIVKHKIFDVTKFGADHTGKKSSKEAIKKAIAKAESNGSGIIFFPKGRYLINSTKDDSLPIQISNSNIVFRGKKDDSGETILFFEKDLPPKDPEKLWTSPYSIEVHPNLKDVLITSVIGNSKRETFSLEVKDASTIKAGDWIILQVQNNHPDLIQYDIQPCTIEKEWTMLQTKGVVYTQYLQVKEISNKNTITFFEPIHYDIDAKYGWEIYRYGHIENIGFENITFEGNWHEPFKHHKNATHDGGWSILGISRSVNSWVKNCHFKNVNRAIHFTKSAYSTAIDCVIEGNYGHTAISAGGGSTGILIGRIHDKAGQWHSLGIAGGSTTGIVIWRCEYPEHTSFELHASQPRCTLFDNIKGGFFLGRGGGARQNLPNHGRYLVLWNYQEIGAPEENFEFWSTKTWFWKVVPPIIVGFHGTSTTFKESDIEVLESLGTPVKPESLWEAQLELRLGKLPKWIKE